MPRKLTTEEFIKRAKQVHGNTYDYSKVIYKGSKLNVEIVCNTHGSFLQKPEVHMRGSGCPTCGEEKTHKNQRKTFEEFISQAKKIHKNKYIYKDVQLKNVTFQKIEIECPIHGVFLQTPNRHLSGNGCIKCSREVTANKLRMGKKDFIEKSKSIHGDTYDYSKVKFRNTHSKVKIICEIHGVFEQFPSHHLKGSRCSKCVGNFQLTTKEYIAKAIEVHGYRYDYSKTIYKNNASKVTIICGIHGEWQVQAASHASGGSGCPKCKNKNEGRIAIYLKNKFITYRQFRIENKYYDFFLPKYNLILERDGEQHYRTNSFQNFYNISGKEYLKRQVKNDKLKTKLAKKAGYKIARIPYWLTEKEEEIEIDNILAGKPTYPDVPDLKQEKTKPRPA